MTTRPPIDNSRYTIDYRKQPIPDTAVDVWMIQDTKNGAWIARCYTDRDAQDIVRALNGRQGEISVVDEDTIKYTILKVLPYQIVTGKKVTEAVFEAIRPYLRSPEPVMSVAEEAELLTYEEIQNKVCDIGQKYGVKNIYDFDAEILDLYSIYAKRVGRPEGSGDAQAGFESQPSPAIHQPGECAALELRLERIQHEHTKATLKATEDAYAALLKPVSAELRDGEPMRHLGNLLYMLAGLHPDDQSRAYEEALVFYNTACPQKQVHPEDGFVWRLVQQTPMDMANKDQLDGKTGWVIGRCEECGNTHRSDIKCKKTIPLRQALGESRYGEIFGKPEREVVDVKPGTLPVNIDEALEALHTQYQFCGDAIIARRSPDAPTDIQFSRIRGAHLNIIPTLKKLKWALSQIEGGE